MTTRPTTLLRFLTATLVVWLAGSSAASALWNHDFWFPFSPLPPVSRFYLTSGFLALLTAESVLLGSLFCLANSLKSWISRILRTLAWSITATTIFITLVGWTLRAYGQAFLTGSFFLNSVLDFSSVRQYLSLRESLTLIAGLLLSMAIASILAIKAPPISAKQGITLAFIVLQGTLIAVLNLRVQPQNQFSQLDADQFRGTVRAGLSPTASMLWSALLYSNPYRNAAVDITLAPRYDLSSYAKSIDRNVRRPNILVFMIEALRAGEVTRTVNGRDVMPASKQLAAQGLNFERAYAQANESAYSAHSLISGLHPLKSSQRDSFNNIDYPLLRIPDLLSPVYHTAYISAIDERWQGMLQTAYSPNLEYFLHAGDYTGELLAADPADDGFRAATESARVQSGALDDAAVAKLLQSWIRQTVAKRDGQPFYAMTYLHTSHFPYETSPAVPPLFTPNRLTSGERAQFSFVYYPRELATRMQNRYWNSLHYIDSQIASTVDVLRQTGVLENTIIAIIGDHGELFYENGHITHAAGLYDKTLHVSFVLSGSPQVPARTFTDPVSSFDLGPMLLHFANMPPYPGFQGSVPPNLLPGTVKPAPPVFSTVQAIAYEDSVLMWPWKFVEQADGAYAHLYNLEADPLEQHSDPRESDVKSCLRETLHQFRTNQFGYFSNDRLKAGFFPPRHQLARTPACTAAFPSR